MGLHNNLHGITPWSWPAKWTQQMEQVLREVRGLRVLWADRGSKPYREFTPLAEICMISVDICILI